MIRTSPQKMKIITKVIDALLFAVQQSGAISLQETADHIGIPKRTLIFYLTRHLSVSLSSFKQKYRLALATKIIEVSPKSTRLTEVAKLSGIKRYVVFARYFKKEFGITPRTYQFRFGATKKLSENANLSNEVIKIMIKRHLKR